MTYIDEWFQKIRILGKSKCRPELCDKVFGFSIMVPISEDVRISKEMNVVPLDDADILIVRYFVGYKNNIEEITETIGIAREFDIKRNLLVANRFYARYEETKEDSPIIKEATRRILNYRKNFYLIYINL